MREIKFRAWGVMFRNEQPKMVYYPLWSTLHSGEVLVFEKEHSYVDDSGYNNDLVLMQYTGLKDKNGKEIYESDIVRLGVLKSEEEDGYDAVAEVMFSRGQFWTTHHGFPVYSWACNAKCFIEVIGNIYENPELLEAK